MIIDEKLFKKLKETLSGCFMYREIPEPLLEEKEYYIDQDQIVGILKDLLYIIKVLEEDK